MRGDDKDDAMVYRVSAVETSTALVATAAVTEGLRVIVPALRRNPWARYGRGGGEIHRSRLRVWTGQARLKASEFFR